jgi:hypothetical protein
MVLATDFCGFVVKLTGSGRYGLLWALQPKSGFLPEARHGRPKFPAMGWGERSQATDFKATFKAKPDS